jgi:hypothetical protein
VPAGWTNQRYAGRQEKWVLASPTSAIANEAKVVT